MARVGNYVAVLRKVPVKVAGFAQAKRVRFIHLEVSVLLLNRTFP